MRTYNKINIAEPEKVIEDLLESSCNRFLGLDFVCRQFRTPSGRIDLIAKSRTNKSFYFIVEIKKGILDENCFCQVHRYTEYMRSNFSDCGRRIFFPLMVGQNLSENIEKCVRFYDKEHINYGSTYYTLFSFDPLSGLSFSYYDNRQYSYEDIHLEQRFSLLKKIASLNFEIDVLKKEIEYRDTIR